MGAAEQQTKSQNDDIERSWAGHRVSRARNYAEWA